MNITFKFDPEDPQIDSEGEKTVSLEWPYLDLKVYEQLKHDIREHMGDCQMKLVETKITIDERNEP